MVGARATSRAMAAAPPRPTASTVRRATSCMELLLGCGWQKGARLSRLRTALDSCEQRGRREDLRQHGGRTLAVVPQIERHTAAAMLPQEAGDLGVAARPVAHEIGDAFGGEGRLNRRACRRRALVEERGHAPCRREVDELASGRDRLIKNGLAGGLGLLGRAGLGPGEML